MDMAHYRFDPKDYVYTILCQDTLQPETPLFGVAFLVSDVSLNTGTYTHRL